MIDAINSYSSIHDGRREKLNNVPSFGRVFEDEGDFYIARVKPPKKQTELGAYLFVSGCAGAISMITDTLLNASELMKSNFTAVGSIAKNAGIWALIGGACFGFFKAIEKVAIGKQEG